MTMGSSTTTYVQTPREIFYRAPIRIVIYYTYIHNNKIE